MKKVLFFFTLLVAMTNLNAQNISKRQIDVNAGIGLLNVYTGAGVSSTIPPLSIAADYAITDKITIGGLVGFSTGKSDRISFFDGTYAEWKYSYILVGARGAYHFDISSKMDTYAGLTLGYIVVSSDMTSNDPYLANLSAASASGIGWAVFAGARYHLNEKWGLFGELGYGISVLTIGATMKI